MPIELDFVFESLYIVWEVGRAYLEGTQLIFFTFYLLFFMRLWPLPCKVLFFAFCTICVICRKNTIQDF